MADPLNGDTAAEDQETIFSDPTGAPKKFGSPSGGGGLGDREYPKIPTTPPKKKP